MSMLRVCQYYITGRRGVSAVCANSIITSINYISLYKSMVSCHVMSFFLKMSRRRPPVSVPVGVTVSVCVFAIGNSIAVMTAFRQLLHLMLIEPLVVTFCSDCRK